MGILGVIILCAISAILYRAGGIDKLPDTNPKWMPMFLRKSWVRDWLCPLFLLLALFLFWRPSSLLSWVLLLPYYGLSGGALSTYWDWINGDDNFYLHGFFCGLAAFPLIVFIPWWILTVRLLICTVGMGLWSKWIKVDWQQEMGKGILFII
jgi:hypothetical protein